MSEASKRARLEMERHNARQAKLVAEVRHRQPRLTEQQIEDVLDTLRVIGELDD